MNIKTWKERLADDPKTIIGSTGQMRAMQSEIDELRAALKAQPVQPAPLTDEQIKAIVFDTRYKGVIDTARAIEAAIKGGVT